MPKTYTLLERDDDHLERLLALGAAVLAFVVLGACLFALDATRLTKAVYGAAVVSTVVVGYLFAHSSSKVELVIGADGLVFYEGDGSTRFVSHEQVERAAAADDRLSLECSMRAPRRFRVAATREDDARGAANRAAIEIQDAKEAWTRAQADAKELRALVIEGDTPAGRLAFLRSLPGEGGRSYRTNVPTRADLWRIAESVVASRMDRVRAVIVLRATVNEDEVERLRAIGADVVEEGTAVRLRVAIEGDDVALGRLLEEQEDAPPSSLPERLLRRRA